MLPRLAGLESPHLSDLAFRLRPMSNLNNPAGRLYKLLVAFDAAASPSVVINDVWAEVLGVSTADLLPALGQAAALLGEVKTVVERTGKPSLAASYATFSAGWATPFLSHGRNPASEASHELIDKNSLVALGMVSEVLGMIAPEGVIPTEEQTTQLNDELNSVLDALEADTELSAELRAAMAARIHDILWAISHVRIVGPDGVQAATEKLVGQLLIFSVREPTSRRASVFQRAAGVALRAWAVFRAGSEAHEALEGWEQMFKALPSGD